MDCFMGRREFAHLVSGFFFFMWGEARILVISLYFTPFLIICLIDWFFLAETSVLILLVSIVWIVDLFACGLVSSFSNFSDFFAPRRSSTILFIFSFIFLSMPFLYCSIFDEMYSISFFLCVWGSLISGECDLLRLWESALVSVFLLWR